MAVSSSLYAIVDKDKPVCGFLNRKTITDASGKKSKDRTWQSLWCQVKEGKIEFYKVNGINLKPHGEPPPRDIYPPPNRQKHKTGFVDLENSWVEIDFTSQKEKDLDKRRRFLFRLILSNNMEYLLQAPSENQMLQWVSSVKKATWSNDEEMEGQSEILKQDARIKASRCSINKKSKHNTNSVRLTGNVLEGEDDVDYSFTSLTQLDPRLVLLRERLQNKRDLLRQLQKMLNSFSGDTECLYKEAETPGLRQNSTRLSNPQSVSTEHEIEAVNRQSAGSDSLSNDGNIRVMTTVLEDYYLVPGVKWSLLKKGDSVEVLGKLANGWYRCRANRDATFELNTFPSSSEEVKLEEEKREEQVITPVDGEEDSFGDDLRQSTIPLEKNSTFMNGNHNEEETVENKMDSTSSREKENGESQDDRRESIPKEGSVFEDSTTDSIDLSFASSIVDREEEFTDFSEDGIQKEQQSLYSPRVRTESYLTATTSFPMRLTITRKDSYNVATTTGLIDSAKVSDSQKTRHLSMIETHNMISPTSDFSHEYELKKLRINNILDHERANNKYDFPLVGAIPSSMLQHFVDQPVSGIRPSSSTSDYGSSAPITEDSPGVNFKTKFNNISASISMEESFQTTCSSEVSGGVDIPNTRENVEEDVGSLTGSINVGSVPSKLFIHTDDKGPPLHNRKDRASSLPPNAIESIEDSSSFTLERERISLSEGPSPELREEEEHEGEMEEDEEEEFKLFKVKRSNSKTMKVIPSPVSTLERRLFDGDNHQVTTNDWKVNDVRHHKRSNSEEEIEKHKKGFFSRIRSNLRGHRKTRPSESSSSSPGTPGYTLGVDEFGDEIPLRSRVTSISGKKIRSRGMGVTFGDSSSESESEETEEKGNRLTVKNTDTGSRSVGSSPLRIRKMKSEEEQSPLARIELPHSPVFKTKSTPLETLRLNLQNSTETGHIRPESRSVSEKRKSPMDGNHKMSGFVQAPAKGVRRQISLKPTQKKYGFHLEHYEVNMNQAKIPRTIVQYVVPGSPAFVAGLYAGDQILSVNEQNLKTAPVSEVVKAIQEADSNKTIELVVVFVDGALRLKVQQKGEEHRMKLHDKQMSLQQVLASDERQSKFPSLPTTKYTCTSPNELESWKEDTPPEENSLHVYNFNRHMNSILSLHHGDITHLSCDMLVIPIRDEEKISEHSVNHVLKAGGEGLMNELCLAEHCGLGDNIVTSGHDLPVEAICHTVFGSNEENIISCVRSALETAYEQCYQTIVFWIDGFISARVSPHLIIGTVRGWLEEDDNCGVFLKIIFSIPSSPAMISLIERYFPLEDYELQKYLQELEYFTSDDEDETDGHDEKQDELQEGDSHTRDSEQLSQSLEQEEERAVCCEDSSNKQTISNSSSPSTDRKTYIQTRFSEIDAIFDSIDI